MKRAADNMANDISDWELDFYWLQIRHWCKDKFHQSELPELKTVLFLVGIQEVGHLNLEYTKEVKQDLMHVATCTLLSQSGYYSFDGLDADGWPHFKLDQKLPKLTVEEQERQLKLESVKYFHSLINFTENEE